MLCERPIFIPNMFRGLCDMPLLSCRVSDWYYLSLIWVSLSSHVGILGMKANTKKKMYLEISQCQWLSKIFWWRKYKVLFVRMAPPHRIVHFDDACACIHTAGERILPVSQVPACKCWEWISSVRLLSSSQIVVSVEAVTQSTMNHVFVWPMKRRKML